jgi:hypothetical protein
MNDRILLPNINVYYYNTIGVLQVALKNGNFSNFKNLVHKCEDGLLTARIAVEDTSYQFSIFISKSMSVCLKETKVVVSAFEVNIRYYVTKNLNMRLLYETLEANSIFNCFNYPANFSELKCSACDCVVLSNLNNMKIVSEFNYNYIDNLEVLSCHESDINNIIPNLDEKLKHMYKFYNIFRINLNPVCLQILTELSIYFDSSFEMYCSSCKELLV